MFRVALTGIRLVAASSLLLSCPGWAQAGQVIAGQVKAVPAAVGSFNASPLRLGQPGTASLSAPNAFNALSYLPGAVPGVLDLAGSESPGVPTPLTVAIETVVPGPLAPAVVQPGAGIPGAVPSESGKASAVLLDEAKSLLTQDARVESPAKTDPSESKGRWDRFWSKSAARVEAGVPGVGDAVVPAAPGSKSLLAAPSGSDQAASQPAPPAPASAPAAPAPDPAAGKKPSLVKAALLPAALGGVYAAARWSLPVWTPAFWVKAAPYVAGGGVLAATFAVNRLARGIVNVLARKAGWQPSTALAVRLITSIAVWTAGGALALHSAGVSTAALLATFGIGGVAMTMAAKEFIGNFLEGMKILVTRPYVIGDRIRIGTADYTVKDMNLRYVELARPDSGTTMMTYTQLSEKPVTVFGEYASRRTAARAHAGASLWSDLYRLAREQPKLSILAASLWTALGLGLSVALPFMPGLLPLKAAAAFIPYIQGAVTLLAARSLEKGAVGFIRRLAESRGWSPQSTVVVKLGVQLLVYLVGGSVALRFFGLTWSALMTTLGASSIAFGWASADVIGNLIQGFWILMNHPFTLGDRVEIGTVSGTVIDMNLNYVVLQGADQSYTLVPYALIKSSPFTVLPKDPS